MYSQHIKTDKFWGRLFTELTLFACTPRSSLQSTVYCVQIKTDTFWARHVIEPTLSTYTEIVSTVGSFTVYSQQTKSDKFRARLATEQTCLYTRSYLLSTLYCVLTTDQDRWIVSKKTCHRPNLSAWPCPLWKSYCILIDNRSRLINCEQEDLSPNTQTGTIQDDWITRPLERERKSQQKQKHTQK